MLWRIAPCRRYRQYLLDSTSQKTYASPHSLKSLYLGPTQYKQVCFGGMALSHPESTMTCELRDELGIQFLMAADQVCDASRELSWAITVTQTVGAKTRLQRVREFWSDMQRDLVTHCAEHGCADEEIRDLLAAKSAVANLGL
jgi:hypothetical protein